ncbi:amino acid adenylation domain-containing protein [Kribbella sp. NPDC051620]|uniref:amino acid adenylation domain-containing protein n=1 Tax=Kribbella sp. NPDC051620 TaxID=3364120 RepID=UPI00379BEA8B
MSSDVASPLPVDHADLPSLVRSAAATAPDHPAVISGECALTYAELIVRAEALAAMLQQGGIGRRSLVAVNLPRSAGLIVALLAVQLTGAAYLPLDPGYPAQRLEFMVTDARACLLICGPGPDSFEIPSVRIDDEGRPLGTLPSLGRTVALRDDLAAIAYVIYTSGSTGTPKAVLISHRSLAHFLASMRVAMPLTPADKLVAVATITFDMSVPEVYLPLACGATLLLPPHDVIRDPRQLVQLLTRSGATVLHATPTLWKELLDHGGAPLPGGLRGFIGAEPFTGALADRVLASTSELTTFYGPTEATVWATSARLTAGQTVPLGRPLGDTAAYVLDEDLMPCPAGEVGELYLAGTSLAQGYLGQAALTAARFVACPFLPDGARMYRTGDLVRSTEEGELVFVSRADEQVKIRGHRVELREIEAALESHPAISEGVAVVETDPYGSARIAAYASPASISREDLHDHLRQQLPPQALPSRYVLLDRLPRTQNGKIARSALAQPETMPPSEPAAQHEQLVLELFRAVLQDDTIGADDDFFLYGGHSLLATQLVSQLQRATGVLVPVSVVFAERTAARLASAVPRLAPLEVEAGQEPVGGLLEAAVSPAQERHWIMHQLDATGCAYNQPIGWRLDGGIDPAALRQAVHDVVLRHPNLRRAFEQNDDGMLRGYDVPAPVLEYLTTDSSPIAGELERYARRPFDLGAEAPFRAALFTVSAELHYLVAVTHHIANDGWSDRIFAADLEHAYQARRGNTEPVWSTAVAGYEQFSRRQAARLAQLQPDGHTPRERQLAYWRSVLDQPVADLRLPRRTERPAAVTFAGQTVRVPLAAPLIEQITTAALQLNATPAMFFQAAVAAHLFAAGAGSDLCLAALSAGRSDATFHQTIGDFGNTWPLRIEARPDLSFAQLVRQVRDRAISAYDHTDIPFQEVIQDMYRRHPGADRARNPLQALVAWHPVEVAPPELHLAGVSAAVVAITTRTAKFELSVNATTRPGGAGELTLEYADHVFTPTTAQSFAERLAGLLVEISHAPQTTLLSITQSRSQ